MGGQHHAPAALVPATEPTSILQAVGGMHGRSGQVWEISPPTGIRTPDRPARNESLYRLSYPGTQIYYFICFAHFPHIHFAHFPHMFSGPLQRVNSQHTIRAESSDCCRKLINVIQQTAAVNAQVLNIQTFTYNTLTLRHVSVFFTSHAH